MPRGVNREKDHHDRIKNKNLFKHHSVKSNKKEFNILDNLLTNDVLSSSNLRNDIYLENFQNELKPAKRDADENIKFEPTSVTLVDLLGGKKTTSGDVRGFESAFGHRLFRLSHTK